MPVTRSSLAAEFLFQAADLGPEVLRVVRLQGTEGISRPYEFTIDCACDDPALDLASVVGEPALLSFRGPETDRWVHGIVSEFERTGRGRELTSYSARLVPKAWVLGLRRNSRVFPPKTTPQILEEVFKDAGLTTDDFEILTTRTYKERKYCVQYRETDLDFVTRMMEKEGMFYFFRQTEERHVLVVTDNAGKCEPIPVGPSIPFEEGGSGLLGPDQITAFRFAVSLCPVGYILRDFDFKKPARPLAAEKGEVSEKLTCYDYPGDFPDEGLGGEYARIRLEEERAEARLGRGEGVCRWFLPGHRFTLEGHPRAELNDEYLILRVEHEAVQPGAGGVDDTAGGEEPEVPYRNVFECVPSSLPYRAPRVTPEPKVEGPQTAVVTGPSGEEIHTDELGRVKIKFPWDRRGAEDDTTSHWVRVSQNWGGAGWGSIFIPRVGQEVVVEHLEGNPDRPIVTGRLYNGERPPPYPLPDKKTVSTIMSQTSPGGGSSNEVRFEDQSGGMGFFVHASKDMNLDVLDAKTESVAANETLSVGGDQTLKVAVDESVAIGGNRTTKIGGKDTWRILGSRTVEVQGSQAEKVGSLKNEVVIASATENVSGNLTSNVGAAAAWIVTGSIDESVSGSKSIMCGTHIRRVNGNDSLESGATRALTCAAYVIKAKAGVSLTAKGAASIAVGGVFKVNAANAVFEGEDKVVLRAGGATIEVLPSSITISGVTIKVDSSEIGMSGSTTAND